VEQQKHAQAKIQERIVAERRKQDAQFEATYRELVVRSWPAVCTCVVSTQLTTALV